MAFFNKENILRVCRERTLMGFNTVQQKGDVSRETSPLEYICYFVVWDILRRIIPFPRFDP